jgi:DNA-binding MarR family transcriptional regulator
LCTPRHTGCDWRCSLLILFSDPAVAKTRAFNRLYNWLIGVLDPHLDGDLSLTQVRLLYQLAHHLPSSGVLTAKHPCEKLGLDIGDVGRELRKFESSGWLCKQTHSQDARNQTAFTL